MNQMHSAGTITREELAQTKAAADLAQIAAVADVMQQLRDEGEWLLLSPSGHVWRGGNPMRLAAQATWLPPGLPPGHGTGVTAEKLACVRPEDW